MKRVCLFLLGCLFLLKNVVAFDIERPSIDVNAIYKKEFKYESKSKETYLTLKISHSVVKNYWRVLLNDINLGWLKEGSGTTELVVPRAILNEAKQNLMIERHESGDKKCKLYLVELNTGLQGELSSLAKVELMAENENEKTALPTRFTITNTKKQKSHFVFLDGADRVIRHGVIYTHGKPTTLLLKPGKYHLYSSRGMEWSVDQTIIEAKKGSAVKWKAKLKKELDLGQHYSADTHIHTFSFSRHGNAAIEERELTFMGEDLDIAIMTDHNHNTTVKPHMHHHTTLAIDGNEVTTPIGHINIFPVDLNKPIVDKKLKTWALLQEGIESHGAEFSILNHPRWPKLRGLPHGPFDKFGFNKETASFKAGVTFPFDAMEVVNSETRNSDKDPQPLVVFEDWLAMRNVGYETLAVGSSDSHTVEGPMGQGRTYLRIEGELTQDRVVNAFKKGQMVVSLGLFCDLKVDEQYRVGDVVPFEKGKKRQLSITTKAPSWVNAKTCYLYENGKVIHSWKLDATNGQPLDHEFKFDYTPKKEGDYLVALLIGDQIDHVYWHAPFESSIGFTNPILFK